MKEKEILTLGFEFIRDWGWYKKYTIEIFTETKSFFRRVNYIELQHTESYHTNTLMPVIKLLIKEYKSDDHHEVLYEGECLTIEELIWVITKTLSLEVVNGKLVRI